jgi:hypothetical protein
MSKKRALSFYQDDRRPAYRASILPNMDTATCYVMVRLFPEILLGVMSPIIAGVSLECLLRWEIPVKPPVADKKPPRAPLRRGRRIIGFESPLRDRHSVSSSCPDTWGEGPGEASRSARVLFRTELSVPWVGERVQGVRIRIELELELELDRT